MSMDQDQIVEWVGVDLDEATRDYIVAQLWSQPDELFPDADNEIGEVEGVDREEHGEMLDHFYSFDDVDGAYVESVREELTDFVTAHPLAVRLYLRTFTSGDLGHNFYLTREGHGTGFWDRGLGELGEYLSDKCKDWGEANMLFDGALSVPEVDYEPGTLYGVSPVTRVPAFRVTETIRHGDYHNVRKFDMWRLDRRNVVEMLASSPYPNRMHPNDKRITKILEDFKKSGRAQFGWADYDLI